MKRIFILLTIIVMSVSSFGCKQKEVEVVKTGEEVENIVEISEVAEETTEEIVEEKPEENIEEDSSILNYEYDIAGYDDDGPHRYRACNGELKKADEKYEMDSSYVPSTKGLEKTYMSGSAEFSFDQFEVLANNLNDISRGQVYIIDLRQEDHLFIDGQSVYWNGTNEGLSSKEVLEKEETLVEELEELLPDREIKTEKELVEDYGFNYVRIAAQDNHFPSPEVVDEFLEFIKTLPNNAWLHFHCKEGKGRTTTFMAMYDIYRNKNVSLKDIAYRQYCLGGIYVLYDGSRLSESAPEREQWEEREIYIDLFYNYIHSLKLGKGSWTSWVEDNE